MNQQDVILRSAQRDEGSTVDSSVAEFTLSSVEGLPQNDSSSTAGFAPVSVLTRAELLDHARHPRNRGELPDAEIVQTEDNPLCGDVVTIYATVRRPEQREGPQPITGRDPSSPEPALERSEGAPQDDAVLDRVGFTGSGCIISQAAASLLTERAVGNSHRDIAQMGRADMETLIGGALSPSRVKCALLPLIALQKGLEAYALHS